jgi:hypothetical protein
VTQKLYTVPLAATAYLTPHALNNARTHLVLFDEDPLRNLKLVRRFCRIKEDSILPDAWMYTTERPTCATCGKAYDTIMQHASKRQIFAGHYRHGTTR